MKRATKRTAVRTAIVAVIISVVRFLLAFSVALPERLMLAAVRSDQIEYDVVDVQRALPQFGVLAVRRSGVQLVA